MALRVVPFGLLVFVSIAAPARAQTEYVPACVEQFSPPHIDLPNGHPVDGVARAVTLFRFHRQQEALRELDTARAKVRGSWRWRVPPDLREEIRSELDALRRCLAGAKPAQMATLRVRVLGSTEDAAKLAPRAGARVHVGGIAVGRTGRDGTLTVRVPSGPIEMHAEFPITEANFVELDLPPGESRSVEIGLSDGKEVDEHTTLVFSEAVDDIVPSTARSLTLKFMQSNRVAPVTSIDQIDIVDRHDQFRGSLAGHFRVVRGEIIATNAAAVFEALRPYFGETIVLQVQAMASSSAMHQGTVAFRVARWPLSVTLEAPPSNPALSLSKIEVGISVIGAGIAVQRVSDAKGSFEVASFPEGTVALECVAVSRGKYYYGDAVLVHSGPRSIRLVLRNVEDLKNGVPPLRVGAPSAIGRVYRLERHP